MEYELLNREISLLEDYRIQLNHAMRFPEIHKDGIEETILEDMQRATERLHKLLNPDEGGMLVSEKAETPQKGDICVFWDDDVIDDGIVRVFFKYDENGLFVDDLCCEWLNCKVIKKGEGNV